MRTRGMTRTHSPSGVLYVANSAQIGGGNRVLMDLATGLDQDDFVPWIVTPGPGPLASWAADHGIAVSSVPDGDWAGRAGLVRRAMQIAARAVTHRVRIVHAMAPMCYRAAGLVGAMLGAVRVCHLGFPPEPGELDWSFQFGPESVVACYDGQAREVTDAVRRAQSTCKLMAIPNAVDTDTFSPSTTGVESRWRFGASHVALIVGHLSDVKGHPTFLRAAARTAGKLGDCAFVLLGGETAQPGFAGHLRELASDLGIASQVHFLGWRPDVADVIRASDVVVLPSLAEGLPIAILEAMACGKPVIATPVNGVAEAIEDGVNGLLVPCGDVEALSAAMVRVLGERGTARRIGEAARRVAESRFSVSRFVSGVAALYEDLLLREDCRRCSSVML
jgi:glycosyltransferase involved in cell wall biosynthesis